MPLQAQGDLAHYAPSAQAKRLEIRGHWGFLSLVHDLWRLVADLESGRLKRDAYLELITRFHRICVPPPLDAATVRTSALEDWRRDSHGDALDFDEFFDAIFELVDVWTETTDAPDYVATLERLVAGACRVDDRGDGVALAWRPHVYFDVAFSSTARPRFRSARSIQRVFRGFSARMRLSDDDGGDGGGRARGDVVPRRKRPGSSKGDSYATPTRRMGAPEVDARIAQLFAAKVHQLHYRRKRATTKKRNRKTHAPRFDAFCLEAFTRSHGTPQAARRHLRTFVESVDGLLMENANGVSAVVAGSLGGDDDAERLPRHVRACLFALASGLTAGAPHNARVSSAYLFPALAALFDDDQKAMTRRLVDREPAPVDAVVAAIAPLVPATADVAGRLAPAATLDPKTKARVVDVDVALYLALPLFLDEDLVQGMRRKVAARKLQRLRGTAKRLRAAPGGRDEARLSPRRRLQAARDADARLNGTTGAHPQRKKPGHHRRRAAAALARSPSSSQEAPL